MDEEELFLNQLFQTFQAEAEEHFSAIRQNLLSYQQAGDEGEQGRLLDSAFREAHNFKGSAATLGLEGMVTLAHALEDRLSGLRKREMSLSAEAFDRLDEWIETLAGEVAGGESRQALMEANPDPHLQALELLTGDAEEATGAPSPPTSSHAASPAEGEEAEAVDIADTAEEVRSPGNDSARRTEGGDRNSAGTVVRISTRKLDRLMAGLGEVYIAQQQQGEQVRRLVQSMDDLIQRLEESEGGALHLELLRQEYRKRFITLKSEQFRGNLYRESLMDELQESIKTLRLQPVESLLAGFQPMAYKLARRSGKQVKLVLRGGATEVDRQILDEIKDPLTHLVRNAIDHGIESPEERRKAGKSPEALLMIAASNESGYLVIQVSDDGRGMDAAHLKKVAVKKGLIDEAQAGRMEVQEAYQLIMRSGFSTREVADMTSGRGVGMDVVKANIERLNGRISIESRPGEGTSFRLRLPLTLAILPSLQLRVGEARFLFPLTALERTQRVQGKEILEAQGEWRLGQELIGLVDLAEFLGVARETPIQPDRSYPLMIFSLGQLRRAAVVDEIERMTRVVVKPLAWPVERARFFTGGTLLEDGSVGLILNPADLLSARMDRAAAATRTVSTLESARRQRLLIVDDSMTTISLERALLEDAGFEVEVALNGVQALDQLKAGPFDLVLTDVQMPELDGIGLTRAIRADERWREMPVIIVSSMGSREDQARGMDAGADAYIIKKAFDQEELLKTIRRLI